MHEWKIDLQIKNGRNYVGIMETAETSVLTIYKQLKDLVDKKDWFLLDDVDGMSTIAIQMGNVDCIRITPLR